MANKKILTLEDQRHLYSTLPELFQGLSVEEIRDIIVKLGLQNILDEGGNLIGIYHVDIHSNKPTYLISDYNIKLTANLYDKGAKKNEDITAVRWERESGVSSEDTAWAQGKTSRELNLTEDDFTSRINSRDVIFRVFISVGNIEFTDEITYSKTQIFNKLQISSSHDLFLENSPGSILMTTVEEGDFSNYRWYVGDSLVASSREFSLSVNSIPLGGIESIKVEARDSIGKTHTDTKTISRLSNGSPGAPGVPGAPGTSTYTWIKYADDAQGAGMTDAPLDPATLVPKEYIGLATNKSTEIESSNPLDYTWAKYIGNDGVPGQNGFMWVKYSEYPAGRDSSGSVAMYDSPVVNIGGVVENMVYMGIAYNKQTQTEAPSDTPEGAPEVYTWAKIKGDDGHSNYVLDLSNENVSVPALANGSIPNPAVAFSTAKTTLRLFYGNDLVDPLDYNIYYEASPGVNYTLSNNEHTLQITGLTQDVGQVLIQIFSQDPVPYLITSATFNIIKLKGVAIYEIVPSVTAIKVNNGGPGQSATLEPTSMEVDVKMNSGDSVQNVTTGKLTYKYIYSNTNPVGTDDGTEIIIGEVLTLSNSGNPLFLEFKYFHPVSNTLVDIERIPFIRDGVSGSSVEQRYRVNSTPGTPPAVQNDQNTPSGWVIVPPVPGTGEVLWMIKAVKAADTGNLIGTWSTPIMISGVPGQTGPPGISGTAGPSPRLLEFVQGETYQNGGAYIDYAYYRTNDVTEGWYTVKLPAGHVPGTVVNAIYTGGIPNSSEFEKAPFAKEMSFGNVVAEQANLAGFLFRNQILTSQAGNNLYCGVTDRGYFPNLTLDGINGLLKFGDRMVQNKDGIVLRDDCGRDRMAFQWVGGVPILKFYDEAGAVTWEAGQSGYIIVTSGTIAPSWGSAAGFSRISTLPTNPDITFGNAVYPTGNDAHAQTVKTFVQARSNQVGPNEISLGGGSHMVSVRRWFNQNAMPSYPTFSPVQNSGGASLYNKGDMAANSTHYEGYYINQTPVIMGQEYNAPELLPDGWYMMEGVTGGNGQELILGPNSQQPGTYIYSVTLVYMKNGNIFKSSYVPLFKYQP